MRKYLRVMVNVAVILCLFMAGSAFSADKVVNIIVHDYPPFYNAKAEGFATSLYRDLYAGVGIKAISKSYPNNRGLVRFWSAEDDAHSPGLVFMMDAKDKIDFVPVYYMTVVFVYYKPTGTTDIFKGNFDNLKNHTVACIKASPYIEFYKKAGIKFSVVETPEQVLQMVAAGRVEFGEAVDISALVSINKFYAEKKQNFGLTENFPVLPVGLAFLKNNPRSQELKNQFMEGLELAKKNGAYIRALERLYGKDNVPKENVLPDMKMKVVKSLIDPDSFLKYKRDSAGLISGSN